ncbi:MarR family transcriptional regulator [Rhodococcus sp. BP-252]|uniref:MarR family winged helix-turn-helix transcriptional regulator n=1 Tax=unclassified Rhodococcus (in: high G+C Gram-positive bacteria) TaxID=192944 RepID=UPI000DF42050|nr:MULTISPECIES: MarR family transcriptional regulator [unclassified Rhodococcus (in: high G+C Gram-positive bacteria)]MBY6412126.1 MarR family transcriptional regulator [Rhodococcus sp. BP-320]MBY6416706.1 MarR family transcriptional regulator [Rhodococcus sp. BP-321]MBY6421105.1 MarR family transcriptional regulator [Rhodococcus sp. BP-324]MBY6426730.1 MarR family transcriptional regulator [Rhodococcus sp. BP-323]MBY6431729.1 MarR family transcriptional regulator [Rhodococcus sp. BP-322]
MHPEETPNLADSFMAVARRIRHTHMNALEPFGLNPSQSRALHVLAREEKPVRLRALADRLRIVARSATDIVDSLEQAELVVRAPDPADRRAVLVELTDDGRRRLQAIDAARRDVAALVFDGLEPAERVELARLLAKVTASA